MKTNKSLKKRLKITKNGILARKPGFNHFNSRQTRTKKLNGKRMREFKMTNKAKSRFLVGIAK